ncbi:MAG: hypothetical protein NTY36_06285 [Deltaproteobacteria bacterium]|nr:hypothetical protein [Deltaproteobacteria bacterium]
MKHHSFTNLLVVATLIICLGPLYPALSNAGTITDNFSGAVINHRLWQPFFNDNPQQAFVQQAGELRLQINGQEFNAGVNGNFLLKGDFTMVVGYTLIKWPTANDVSLGFECGGRGENSNVEMLTRRFILPSGAPEPRENYGAFFRDGSPQYNFTIPNLERSGRLKVTRVGSVMTGYFEQNGVWQVIGSHDYSATGMDEWLEMCLSAAGHTAVVFSQDAAIAFDNFQVTYDQIRYLSAVPAGTMLLLD